MDNNSPCFFIFARVQFERLAVQVKGVLAPANTPLYIDTFTSITYFKYIPESITAPEAVWSKEIVTEETALRLMSLK